jgi:hypothetical protein
VGIQGNQESTKRVNMAIRIMGTELSPKSAREMILYLAEEIAKEEQKTKADVLIELTPSFEEMPEEEPSPEFDVVLIPEWAIGAIHYSDYEGLDPGEVELINLLHNKYPGAYYVVSGSGEGFFSNNPEIGLPCTVIEHLVVYPKDHTK